MMKPAEAGLIGRYPDWWVWAIRLPEVSDFSGCVYHLAQQLLLRTTLTVAGAVQVDTKVYPVLPDSRLTLIEEFD